ncbi:unnamed protein product [marine sediment metagenome]|uniref:Uncharacterized protein n=1 Tax=marine sediment metagenome TaxID=412755 RepID=X1D2E6_9ZZZZ
MSDTDNEGAKLKTRRWLAWGIVGIGVSTEAFLAIWGATTGRLELVTLAGGALIAQVSGIAGYYFGKKTSEE